MNAQTATLIERPYQEIVDDLLTSIAGGIVNEPQIFDVKTELYPLAQSAREVRGITGTTTEGKRQQFLNRVDFNYDQLRRGVVWQDGGARPGDLTTFYVDYFPAQGESPLTDLNVGSVTRTLAEAMGREIATVYQQINLAYQAGFLDTAAGKALDFVVAILGIRRYGSDFAVGLATFFRESAAAGNITIAEGTLVTTTKGDVTFQTTEQRTLQRGQERIDVPIRALAAFPGDAGNVPAAAIAVLAQPIAGIARVTNFEPTVRGARDESDDELRARALTVLRSLSKGTLAAIQRAILEGRGSLLEVWDPNSSPLNRHDPGGLVLLVEAEPERFASLRARVEETRAAGVQTTIVARYIFIKPRIAAFVRRGLPAAGKQKIAGEIIAALQGYIDGLDAGRAAEGKAMLQAIQGIEGVDRQTRIVDVLVWQSDIGQGQGAATASAILQALASAAPDDAVARRDAVQGVLEAPLALLPTGRRMPNRQLLKAAADENQASDAQLERGEFRIVPPSGAEKWWIVLDMDAADVAIAEA